MKLVKNQGQGKHEARLNLVKDQGAVKHDAIDVFRDRVITLLSGEDAQLVRYKFDSLMTGNTARKNLAEAALLLAEEASSKRNLHGYFGILKLQKAGGLNFVLKLERAKEALASLQTGRHETVGKEADARPCLKFIEIVTRQAACMEFRAVCVMLMMELGDQPEKLTRRLIALEKVALCFVLRAAVPAAERQARARAMMESMHREAEMPPAYRLTVEERRACVEGLNASFVGPKLVSVATAILLKLNAEENFEMLESTEDAVVFPPPNYSDFPTP